MECECSCRRELGFPSTFFYCDKCESLRCSFCTKVEIDFLACRGCYGVFATEDGIHECLDCRYDNGIETSAERGVPEVTALLRNSSLLHGALKQQQQKQAAPGRKSASSLGATTGSQEGSPLVGGGDDAVLPSGGGRVAPLLTLQRYLQGDTTETFTSIASPRAVTSFSSSSSSPLRVEGTNEWERAAAAMFPSASALNSTDVASASAPISMDAAATSEEAKVEGLPSTSHHAHSPLPLLPLCSHRCRACIEKNEPGLLVSHDRLAFSASHKLAEKFATARKGASGLAAVKNILREATAASLTMPQQWEHDRQRIESTVSASIDPSRYGGDFFSEEAMSGDDSLVDEILEEHSGSGDGSENTTSSKSGTTAGTREEKRMLDYVLMYGVRVPGCSQGGTACSASAAVEEDDFAPFHGGASSDVPCCTESTTHRNTLTVAPHALGRWAKGRFLQSSGGLSYFKHFLGTLGDGKPMGGTRFMRKQLRAHNFLPDLLAMPLPHLASIAMAPPLNEYGSSNKEGESHAPSSSLSQISPLHDAWLREAALSIFDEGDDGIARYEALWGKRKDTQDKSEHDQGEASDEPPEGSVQETHVRFGAYANILHHRLRLLVATLHDKLAEKSAAAPKEAESVQTACLLQVPLLLRIMNPRSSTVQGTLRSTATSFPQLTFSAPGVPSSPLRASSTLSFRLAPYSDDPDDTYDDHAAAVEAETAPSAAAEEGKKLTAGATVESESLGGAHSWRNSSLIRATLYLPMPFLSGSDGRGRAANSSPAIKVPLELTLDSQREAVQINLLL